ncbi:potassium channel subfamily K member 18 isoform X2 [Pararge aegeria]|uniref:potassium channel subfamily K member 18 isoform X2 n=1 Tax=Pararge aegeria TaxID=116150 RepID=UPI0019D31584|nr:potassium channel subfamily K member 18 isoform X2 [Pararge aegeria]
MNTLEVPGYPPPPPPKRPDKPKITLQIPSPVQTTPRAPTTPSIYWGPTATKYYGKTPQTPASLRSDPHTNPYFNPFMHMYQNKASDFMFKQFEGFKDFTMNTAKSGLSAGEKSAFWFYNKLKLLSKKWFTHFFLTICLVLYSIMGAAMFMALEGPYEEQYDKNLTDVRREVASRIQSALTNHSSLEDSPDILEFIENDLAEYEQSFMEYLKHVNNNDTKKKTWSFWNAMFYAGTIYTTIGYGHIAPKTTYGRVATIVYAIIGIPLFLIVLADFGKLFTRIIKFFWAFIRRFYYTRSCRSVRRTVPVQGVMKGLNTFYDVVRRPSQIFTEEDIEGAPMPDGDKPPPMGRKPSDVPPPLPPKPGTLPRDFENETEPETPAPSVFEIDDEFNLPISVAIFILVVYIIIGAVGYNFWETWDFFESFYFVFISMSTIGLGDMVPDHPMFMMASILYLVFGLALTSMCINVVQVKLSDTFKQASAKLGATIGLKVAEEDGSLVPMTPPPIEVPAVHKPKAEVEESKSKEILEDDDKTR